MQSKYIVEERGDNLLLHEKSKGYTLFIEIENRFNPSLEVPAVIGFHNHANDVGRVAITSRDKKEYPEEIQELEIDTSLQYVEIGAGLAEFTPSLVLIYNGRLSHRPIVIDPADYRLMRDMMLHAKSIYFDSHVKERLDILIERTNIILDRARIRLINNTLERALLTHTELEGSADFVIDFNGANMYFEPYDRYRTSVPSSELESKMKELESELLKPNGRLLSYVHD